MSTNAIRAALAILSLVALIAAGAAAFLLPLTEVQQNLITMVVTAIIARGSSSFSFFFDGVPDKTSYPATTTVDVKKV